MITLGELRYTQHLNSRVEERLEHIIDIMTDCDVAEFVPTNLISQWRYAPERSCVIAEKEYRDPYGELDQWESYSIPVECLTMSDEELETLFRAEAEIQEQIQEQEALKQLKRDADRLGFHLIAKENT